MRAKRAFFNFQVNKMRLIIHFIFSAKIQKIDLPTFLGAKVKKKLKCLNFRAQNQQATFIHGPEIKAPFLVAFEG